jgi:hypothetical protein
VVSAAQDTARWPVGFPDEQAFRRREDFSDRLHPDPSKTGNLLRLDEASGTILDSIRLDELLGVTDPGLDYVRDAPRLGELAAEAVPAGQGAGSARTPPHSWCGEGGNGISLI